MESGEQNKEILLTAKIEKPNRKKIPFLSWRKLHQWKAMDVFLYYSSLTFIFPSIKGFSFSWCAETCTWFAMDAGPELQFSAKSIFAGEIPCSPFVLS